jgi:hypothetical protein
VQLAHAALLGWIRRQQKQAWNSWYASWLQYQRAHRVLAYAISRWRLRLLAAAWRHWQHLMLATRAALALEVQISLENAALRVQKEAAARMMASFLMGAMREIIFRLLLRWRAKRLQDLKLQMEDYVKLLADDRDAAREAEELVLGRNRTLQSEREALELKLQMLVASEEHFRIVLHRRLLVRMQLRFVLVSNP